MRRGLSLSCAYLAVVTILVSAGCGQATSPSDQSSSGPTRDKLAQAEKASKPKGASERKGEYDVRVASAESPATTRPTETASAAAQAKREAGQPNPLPAAERLLPLDEDTSEELVMPRVVMSDAHAKLCRVHVGDQFPAVDLADLKGQQHTLGDLLGKKLTIVAFWNAKQPTALDELADLEPKFEQRFAPDGVSVVGINSGDDPKLASELAEHAKCSFVNLSDTEGKALAQVGAPKTPRTYLLDSSGKILWFDIEYSRTTRRELAQAIRFSLAQP